MHGAMISGGWVCALHVRTAGLGGAALGSDEEEILYLAFVVIDVLTNQVSQYTYSAQTEIVKILSELHDKCEDKKLLLALYRQVLSKVHSGLKLRLNYISLILIFSCCGRIKRKQILHKGAKNVFKKTVFLRRNRTKRLQNYDKSKVNRYQKTNNKVN